MYPLRNEGLNLCGALYGALVERAVMYPLRYAGLNPTLSTAHPTGDGTPPRERYTMPRCAMCHAINEAVRCTVQPSDL